MTPSYPPSSSFLYSFILDPQGFMAWKNKKLDCENKKKKKEKKGQTQKGKRDRQRVVETRNILELRKQRIHLGQVPMQKRHPKTKPRVDLRKHDGGTEGLVAVTQRQDAPTVHT